MMLDHQSSKRAGSGQDLDWIWKGSWTKSAFLAQNQGFLRGSGKDLARISIGSGLDLARILEGSGFHQEDRSQLPQASSNQDQNFPGLPHPPFEVQHHPVWDPLWEYLPKM